MSYDPNRSPAGISSVIDYNRLAVGNILGQLISKDGLPFSMRQLETGQLVQIVTDDSVPAFEAKLRDDFVMHGFKGETTPLAEEKVE